jgi:hypothetical protein
MKHKNIFEVNELFDTMVEDLDYIKRIVAVKNVTSVEKEKKTC